MKAQEAAKILQQEAEYKERMAREANEKAELERVKAENDRLAKEKAAKQAAEEAAILMQKAQSDKNLRSAAKAAQLKQEQAKQEVAKAAEEE